MTSVAASEAVPIQVAETTVESEGRILTQAEFYLRHWAQKIGHTQAGGNPTQPVAV